MEESIKTRLVLPCADSDGEFMCSICQQYLPSVKTLYNHMRSNPCYSNWDKILPEPKYIKNFTSVSVRYRLLHPIPSNLSSDHVTPSICSSGDADLPNFQPGWPSVKNKKRRSNLGHSKNLEAVAKKIKVGGTKNDGALPEIVANMAAGGGGNVVFDFDLNVPLPVIIED